MDTHQTRRRTTLREHRDWREWWGRSFRPVNQWASSQQTNHLVLWRVPPAAAWSDVPMHCGTAVRQHSAQQVSTPTGVRPQPRQTGRQIWWWWEWLYQCKLRAGLWSTSQGVHRGTESVQRANHLWLLADGLPAACSQGAITYLSHSISHLLPMMAIVEASWLGFLVVCLSVILFVCLSSSVCPCCKMTNSLSYQH